MILQVLSFLFLITPAAVKANLDSSSWVIGYLELVPISFRILTVICLMKCVRVYIDHVTPCGKVDSICPPSWLFSTVQNVHCLVPSTGCSFSWPLWATEQETTRVRYILLCPVIPWSSVNLGIGPKVLLFCPHWFRFPNMSLEHYNENVIHTHVLFQQATLVRLIIS